MTCNHNWSAEPHEGLGSHYCHVCNEWEIEVNYDRALAEAERLRLERDEARATLAFMQAEYGNAADETLTRDALELKVKLLEHQLTSIKTAFHELRVLRSSCEDSNAGSLRVHLVEAEFDKLHSLLR